MLYQHDETKARTEDNLYVARWYANAALFPDREALAAAINNDSVSPEFNRVASPIHLAREFPVSHIS